MPEKQIWFTLHFFGIAVFPILSIFYHCIANSSLFQKCCAQLPHRFRSPLSFSLLQQSRKASGNTQFHLTLSVDDGCTQKCSKVHKLHNLEQCSEHKSLKSSCNSLRIFTSFNAWGLFPSQTVLNSEILWIKQWKHRQKNSSLQQQRYESSKVSILSSQTNQKKKNSFNRGARSRKTSFAPFFSALKIDCRS